MVSSKQATTHRDYRDLHELLKYGFCKKSLRKSEPKVFNWSKFYFSEVTSYKIHTLGIKLFVFQDRKLKLSTSF